MTDHSPETDGLIAFRNPRTKGKSHLFGYVTYGVSVTPCGVSMRYLTETLPASQTALARRPMPPLFCSQYRRRRVTLTQALTSLIADAEHTKALDLLEQHLRAQSQAGNLTASLDYLVLRDMRERLGDEVAALDLVDGLGVAS